MHIESKIISFVLLCRLEKEVLYLGIFIMNSDDETTAICVTCEEAVCHGGKDSKNFNTTNLRSQTHSEKFDELEVKRHEEANKKEEQVVKRRKLSETCQLTLKEQKDPWKYDNSEHK